MKFQNPSMHCLEVMLCIKKRNGRTHRRTHKRPRSNMPLQLLRSWGQNKTTLFITEKKARGIFSGMLICADILLDVFDTPDIFWVWLICRICLWGKH